MISCPWCNHQENKLIDYLENHLFDRKCLAKESRPVLKEFKDIIENLNPSIFRIVLLYWYSYEIYTGYTFIVREIPQKTNRAFLEVNYKHYLLKQDKPNELYEDYDYDPKLFMTDSWSIPHLRRSTINNLMRYELELQDLQRRVDKIRRKRLQKEEKEKQEGKEKKKKTEIEYDIGYEYNKFL